MAVSIALSSPLIGALPVVVHVTGSKAFHFILVVVTLIICVLSSQSLKPFWRKVYFFRTVLIYKRLPIGDDFTVSKRVWYWCWRLSLLKTSADLNLGDRVLGEIEKNNFIALPGKGGHRGSCHSRLCPNQGMGGGEGRWNGSRVGLLIRMQVCAGPASL